MDKPLLAFLIIICLALPIILLGNTETTSSFQEIEAEKVSELILIEKNSLIGHSGVLMGIEAQLWEMTRKYELNYERFYGLAKCESRLNPNAEGKAGEIGIFQFLPSTFSDYAKRYKKVGFSIHDTSNQIELAAQMIADGKASEWVCVY